MAYTIYATDKENALELRLATRPSHVEYLKSLGSTLMLAGPVLSPDDKPCGSLIILDVSDMSEARAIADKDPYTLAGLFQAVDIKPYNPLLGSMVK